MKELKQTIIWGMLFVCCICFSVYQLFPHKQELGYEEVSNNQTKGVIGWGIKRNGGGKTTDADPGTPALLQKYGAISVGDTTKKTIYLTFDEG